MTTITFQSQGSRVIGFDVQGHRQPYTKVQIEKIAL